MGAKFSRPVARGVGRVVRSRLVSSTWTWEAGGNCTTWGFDTPVTRRWGASCSAKPPGCGRARWVWWGGVGRIVVDVEPVATKPSGQPRTEAGLPGQRSCAACDCTDVDAMAAFATDSHEAAAMYMSQTVSMTFVARRSSMAA